MTAITKTARALIARHSFGLRASDVAAEADDNSPLLPCS